MESWIIINFLENKTFLQMQIRMNNQTTNKKHYHLNNSLLSKWKRHHRMVLLTPNLLKIVIKIHWYLNLCSHKNQTCHQKLNWKSTKNLLLDKVKDNLHSIVPNSLYKGNQIKGDLLQEKRRDFVDMKIFKVERKVCWMNSLKNNSVNRVIKTKFTNLEFRI